MKHRKGLKLNNRGSGIITVLIAILFLTAFGSVLLMLSYTGYEMRISDRKGKENLYDASSVMEQINTGMQEVCSEAIVYSYGGTLVRFNDFGVNVTREFQENYRKFIGSCKYNETNDKWEISSDNDDIDIIYKDFTPGNLGKYRYNLDTIRAVIERSIGQESGNSITFEEPAVTDPEYDKGPIYSFTGGNKKATFRIYAVNEEGKIIKRADSFGDGFVTGMSTPIVLDEEPEPIVLKGVCVEFINKDRLTKISTDITLNYPKIGYSNKTYKSSGLNSHACVVEGDLIQMGGSPCQILGSAYFGGVVLSGSSNMTFSVNDSDESRFVINGDINVTAGGVKPYWYSTEGAEFASRFVMDPGSELWAKNIKIHTQGTASLLGSTYVADNLEFDGPDSKAVLAGKYYGFGTGYDANGNHTDESSSIISNQSNTKPMGQNNAPVIDMTGLDELTLAGVAFVGRNPGYYSTAESMSSRQNQLAYLVPYGLVTYDYTLGEETVPGIELKQNPEVMSGDRAGAITAWHIADAPLWPNSSAKPSDYGINAIQTIYERTPGTDQVVAYAFAKFSEATVNGKTYTAQENANRFFRDFFKFNPDEAAKYVTNYVQITGRAKNAASIGNTFYNQDGTKVELENYVTGADVEKLIADAQAQKLLYDKYCETLNMSDIVTDDDEENPLTLILKDDALENITNGYIDYRDEDGKMVAIASNEDIKIFKQNNAYKITAGHRTVGTFNTLGDLPCLIVTTGNVEIIGEGSGPALNYDGLILCKGDLTLKDNVIINRDPENVTKALVAKSSNGNNITDFLNNETGDDEKAGAAWTVTALVTYDNWNRSTED